MNTTSKMVLQYLASCYEYILSVGEGAVLEELKKLDAETLSLYPHILDKMTEDA